MTRAQEGRQSGDDTENAAEIELRTARVQLRRFVADDAPIVEPMLSAWEVAATTTIPHPYPAGAFVGFVRALDEQWRAGTTYSFAIIPATAATPIGSMTLAVEPDIGELRYWVGKPFWGNGYATEAGARVVRFGFEHLHLPAIRAVCLTRNVASARVLEKIGFEHTERRPATIPHYGAMEDADHFVLTVERWRERSAVGQAP